MKENTNQSDAEDNSPEADRASVEVRGTPDGCVDRPADPAAFAAKHPWLFFYRAVIRAVVHYFARPKGPGGGVRGPTAVTSARPLESEELTKAVSESVVMNYLVRPEPRSFWRRKEITTVHLYRISGEDVVDKVTLQTDGSKLQGWN